MSALLLALALAGAGPFEAVSSPVIIDSEVDATEVARWRTACEQVAQRMTPRGRPWNLRLRQALTIEDFVRHTGRARFEAAALVQDTVWIQPKHILDRIPAADGVRRHECVHVGLRQLGIPPLPPALEEAVAAGLSGQAARLPPGTRLDRAGLIAANRVLTRPKSAEALQSALQDVVTTLWPELSVMPTAQRNARLMQAARSDDWMGVLLPAP